MKRTPYMLLGIEVLLGQSHCLCVELELELGINEYIMRCRIYYGKGNV